MRNLKKVLSLVLCVAVMLSVMVMGAGAAFSDQDKIENTEAVDACSALNILVGYEDGSFHPERNIKRSEVTKMICVALNGGKEPNVSSNAKPTFKDVRGTIHAWAEGYIESCVAQGIVDGVGGDRFAPAGNVTGAQLAKMLLVSLGYKAENEGFTGNAWETNVNVRATQKHLYDGLEKMDTSAAVTRDQASQMVWNAMQAYEVEYKTTIVTDPNGNLVTQVVVQDKVVGNNNDKITLLRDKYDAWVYVGTLTKVDSTNITISMTASDRDASDPKPESTVDHKDFTKLKQDYSALMGQKVKVLFKDGKTNEVIGVYATGDNTVHSTIMNAVEEDNGKIKFNDTSYSVDANIATYINGTSVGNKSAANFDDGAYVDQAKRDVANNISADEVKFVDTDNNGKIDTAIITTVDAAKVTYASKEEIVAGGTTYKYADEKIASDVQKDDYVAIRQDLYNDCKNITRANKLTGVKLTGTKENPSKYLLDGTWYVAGKNADMNSVKSGDTVDAYTINGVVFYAKRTSGENTSLSDVAIVLAVGSDIQGDKVKILKLDGTTKTEIVDIDKDPGSDYVAKDKLTQGAAYEYSVKGGEYRFKALDTKTDYYGDYTALNNGAPTDTDNGLAVAGDKDADKSISSVKVDDSAKIVLIDKYNADGTDYKVITGKQFKSLAVGTADKNVYAKGGIAAFTSKVDGVKRVSYAVVAVKGIADTFVTNDHYGYVVENAYKTDNGYVVYTIWTGTENVKVQEKSSTLHKKGEVLGYSSITKEENLPDSIAGTIEDVDNNIGLKDGAIYGVNKDQSEISLDGTNNNSITKDTVVLYVDTKDHKGFENGTIQKADESASGLVNNVMYRLDGSAADADVSVLIVDVKNNLHGSFAATFDQDAKVEDIQAALNKEGSNVTVSKDFDTATTLTVSSNTTLTLTTKDPKKVTVKAAADAKVVVNGTTYVGDGGILDITPAPVSPKGTEVKVAVTLTFGEAGAVTVNVENGVTVNVNTKSGWTFPMTFAGTGTVTVDGEKAASDVKINMPQAAAYRPEGPSSGSDSHTESSNFNYQAAYEKYGMTLTGKDSAYTIEVNNKTLSDAAAKFNSSNNYIKSDLYALVGGANADGNTTGSGPLTVGLLYTAPAGATHAKVNEMENAQDLQNEVGIGGVSGWKGNLLCYTSLTQVTGNATDNTVKVDPVKATTKTQKLTWLKGDVIMAISNVTLNITVK